MENTFGLKFLKDFMIQSITGYQFKLNDQFSNIHGNLHFNGYAKLTESFKKHLNLNDKWQAIAFEAHGKWHKDEIEFYGRWQKPESERKAREFIDNTLKPTICQEKSIIYLVIYEDIPQEDWLANILEQIYKQTGLKLSEKNFPNINY